MENPTLSVELVEQNIKQKLEEAKLKAAPITGIKMLLSRIEELLIKKEKKQINTEESEELQDLQDVVDNNSVIVQTLHEFRILLDDTLGKLNPTADRIMAHENAHANVVEKEGATFKGYRLLVAKNSDNKTFTYRPGVIYDFPEGFPEEKKREIEINVICAPEDYGENLSTSDKDRIERWRD